MTSLSSFVRFARTRGLSHVITHSFRRVKSAALTKLGRQGPRIDLINQYGQVLGHDHGDIDAAETADRDLLQWVIPNFGFGSGGHLNIFRFIRMLSARGYRQRLVILPPYSWKSKQQAQEMLAKWYFPLDAEVALGIDGFRPAGVTIATGWQTAYWVHKHRGSREKFYFVQDFEPYFYPVSSDYVLAENTYRLGLKAITAGSWLSDKLAADYGMSCLPVSFGVETSVYRPTERKDHPHFNILFYSRHVTPRRLFEVGLVALDLVAQQEPNVAVIFAGGDVSAYKIDFPHLNAGEMKLDELPDLYSQCDLALVLSGTNLSLLPLEVAACGCPVVLNDAPSARWLLPDEAAFYSSVEPVALAQTILAAVRDPDLRAIKAETARAIAQAADWEEQCDAFLYNLEQLRED